MVKYDINSYEIIYVAHVSYVPYLPRVSHVFYVPYMLLSLTYLTCPVPALLAPCTLYLNFHFTGSYF